MKPPLALPSGQVTFLFTDIEASTRLALTLGDAYRTVLQQHRVILRTTIGRYEGAELLTEGDSFFVAFPDPSAALHACVDAQRAINGHPWPAGGRPRVRMGLHTGHAIPYGGEYASQEVHRASRVASAAHGGQVLCSGATASRVDRLPESAWLLDLGLHRLRGFDDRERLYQLVAPGLERHFPRPRTLGPVAHNLPAPSTSFVGRAAERVELRSLIQAHRLVTVSGPGGVGKTRLALEVAGDLTSAYPDGVWFADLAATSDPALVAVSVASAFGLRPEPGRPVAQTLAEHTRQHRCLLLLDTCEHQRVWVAALVSQLLAACPKLTVVATSREPLGLAGEVVWRIPPLSLVPVADKLPSDAVELLLDRATAARGGCPDAFRFELPQLDRIARRLDGLPLALELAAARLRVLSAAELAERLDDVLSVLDAPGSAPPAASGLSAGGPEAGPEAGRRVGQDNGPAAGPQAGPQAGPDGDAESPAGPGDDGDAAAASRHSTLTTTVDWSYRTLGDRPARLLRRMAVFAGPVDLDAIEWLFGEPALGPLAVLVDKSLVQVEGGPRNSRYRMLDTIRAFATRRLAELGEEPDARSRHVTWCLQAVEQAGTSADGVPVTRSMYALDPLREEVRRALHWSANGGSVRHGLRLISVLEQWWRERGLAREARVWLFRLYEQMTETGVHVPSTELADAYHAHALLAGADGEHAEQLRFSERAELAAQRADDAVLLARVLAERGDILAGLGAPEQAEAACRSAIRFAREHGAEVETLPSLYCLAYLLWQRGELGEARDLLTGGDALEAGQPVWRGQRRLSFLLGLIAMRGGEMADARRNLVAALRARMAHGFHSGVVEGLYAMACWSARTDDYDRAALLFGAADTHRRALRVSTAGYEECVAADQARTVAALREAYQRRYDAGTQLGLARAVDVATTGNARGLELVG